MKEMDIMTRAKEILSKMAEEETPETYQYLVDNLAGEELLEDDPHN